MASCLADFASELAHEERNFRDELNPALAQILAAIQNRSMNKFGLAEGLSLGRGADKRPPPVKQMMDMKQTPPPPITDKCVECGRNMAGSKTVTLCPYCLGSLCERCAHGHHERMVHPETPEAT